MPQLAAIIARDSASSGSPVPPLSAASLTVLSLTSPSHGRRTDEAAAPSGHRVRKSHQLQAGPGRGGNPSSPGGRPAAAVAWYGVSVVRYALARTAPGHVAQLSRSLRPGGSAVDSLYPVLHAYASAMSMRRWAIDLGLAAADPADEVGDLLTSVAERALLGLLPWLPVRMAAAASRHRPDEVPGYLEAVAAAWLVVRQVAPALPFGGRAAASDSTTGGARLVLADAVAAVLASGLAMTGASLCSRDD